MLAVAPGAKNMGPTAEEIADLAPPFSVFVARAASCPEADSMIDGCESEVIAKLSRRQHRLRVETGGWFSAPDQTLAVPPETGPAEGLFGVVSRHCGCRRRMAAMRQKRTLGSVRIVDATVPQPFAVGYTSALARASALSRRAMAAIVTPGATLKAWKPPG